MLNQFNMVLIKSVLLKTLRIKEVRSPLHIFCTLMSFVSCDLRFLFDLLIRSRGTRHSQVMQLFRI